MKKLSLVGFILVVCFSMLLATASAQDATPINFGDTVNGTLTADSNGQLTYSFNGTAGADVTINMASNDFDAYLVLTDATGTVIAEDDDSGGRLDAQITTTLPRDGTFTIIATSLRAYRSNGQFSATGNFTLTLTGAGNNQVATPVPFNPTMVPTPTIAFNTPEPTFTPTPSPFTPVEPDLAGTIGYGDSIGSTIPQNYAQQRYLFSGTAGDVVEITLISADFDGYLFLYDSAGAILTQDDDAAGDRNPRIVYTLPTTGDYIIGADSFGNVVGINPAFGVFTLTLMLQGTGGPIEPVETLTVTLEVPDDGELDLGETVNNNFTSEVQERVYTFTGTAGQIVTFALSSVDVDTYLILRDVEGTVIAENDDMAGSLNSQIGPFQLAEDSTYEVVATTYSYVYSGEFINGAFTLTATETVPTVIEYADLNEGILSADGDTSIAYAFEGTTGEVVTIDLTTLSYSLYIQILGPNGTVNQTTAGGNALLGPVVLPTDGLYVVIVSSYDLFEPSDFSFVVSTIEPLPITYDEPVTNTFSEENTIYVYTFEGAIGDGVDVVVSSAGAVDTRITLTAPSGNAIAFDDDSGVGFDPELMGVVLTEDGTYSLLVQPYIKGDSGEFTVAVNASSSMALDEESLIVRLSDKTLRGVGIFEGVAGETVMLSVRVIAGAENEPYITVTQGEEVLAVQSIGSVKRLILELEIPADGPVQVSVEDFNYGSAVIEFSIER